MKALFVAAAIAAGTTSLFAANADAAPFKGHHHVSASERAAIARSNARLKMVHAQVYADGKVTSAERIRLARAQRHHAALLAKLRHR